MLDKKHFGFDLLALVLGALLPLAFAPVNFLPLSFIIPAGLFFIIYESPKSLAFRRGYIFGFGLFVVGASWIYVAISDFGFTSAPIAFLLTLIFVAVLALFHGFQAVLSVMLAKRLRFGTAALLFAVVWLLFEWIRGWFMTGFPWLNLGYAHIDNPLSGFAPLIGVYGISFISLLLSAGMCFAINRKRVYRLVPLGLFAFFYAMGWGLQHYPWTEKAGQPIKVAIVQPSLSQITKWDPTQIRRRMDIYTEMTEPLWGQHDLIMWPENSLSILWQDAPLDFKDNLQSRASETNTAFVLGVPYGDIKTRYYSSLVVLGKQQGVYHKRHLVPFGEFVPLPDFAKRWAGFFELPMSGFSAGEDNQAVLEVAGQKMAPTICYEDAFGEELIDFLPEATVLINGSNNAWYGRSWAASQHLQIARMRAIETQRQSIRSTTTGISALIDERGKLLNTTELYEKTVLTGTVQPLKGATPYVRWGNWPVIIFVFLVIMGFIGRAKKRRAA